MSTEQGGNRFEIGIDGPSVILAAVDGSPTSLRAGAYAAGMARRQHSRLLIVSVAMRPALAGMVPEALVGSEEAGTEVFEELQKQAQEALERLRMEGEFLGLWGDPYTEIVRVADERRVDAVVVGASTSAGHRLVGSLAARLVRSAKWPVTVVP